MKPFVLQTLSGCLEDWWFAQCELDTIILTVDDYGEEGKIVKVNGEEPEGINNVYYDIEEMERDLVKLVPGYGKDARIWHEGHYETS